MKKYRRVAKENNNKGFEITMEGAKIFLLKESIFRRLLLSEIKKLQKNNEEKGIRGCTAGSKHLAKLFNVSIRKIKREIALSKKSGYIKTHIEKKYKGGEIKQLRRIFIQDDVINENINEDYFTLNRNKSEGFWLSREFYMLGNSLEWTLIEACIYQQIETYSNCKNAEGCGYTRGELSKLFGTHKQRAGQAVNKLINKELVEEIDNKFWSTRSGILLAKIEFCSNKSGLLLPVTKVDFCCNKSGVLLSQKWTPINKDINKNINESDELRSSEIQKDEREIPKEKENKNSVQSYPLEQSLNKAECAPGQYSDKYNEMHIMKYLCKEANRKYQEYLKSCSEDEQSVSLEQYTDAVVKKGEYQKELKNKFDSECINIFKKMWLDKYFDKTGKEYNFNGDPKGIGQIRYFLLEIGMQIMKCLRCGIVIFFEDVINFYFNNDFWFTKVENGFTGYTVGQLVKHSYDIFIELQEEMRRKRRKII